MLSCVSVPAQPVLHGVEQESPSIPRLRAGESSASSQCLVPTVDPSSATLMVLSVQVRVGTLAYTTCACHMCILHACIIVICMHL